jgi:general stress protein 26
MLTWEFVEERLRNALNYWVATIGPDGAPHVRPVDGVWVDGALCFGGSPETRWVRNLMADPRVSVNLGSEEEAVILQGTAEHVADPDHPLAPQVPAASKAKYPQYYTTDEAPPSLPFWCLRPTRVYAWTLAGFATNPTRWDFRR